MREQGPHDVTLSERERQVLKELEAQLRRDGRLGVRISRSVTVLPGGWAAVLLALGAVTMFFAALAVSLLVAFVGGVLLAAGFALACLRLLPAAAGWLRRNL